MLITNITQKLNNRIGSKRGYPYDKLKDHLNFAIMQMNAQLALRLPEFYDLKLYEEYFRRNGSAGPKGSGDVRPLANKNKILAAMNPEVTKYSAETFKTENGVASYDNLGNPMIDQILIPLAAYSFFIEQGIMNAAEIWNQKANIGISNLSSVYIINPGSDFWYEQKAKESRVNSDYDNGEEYEDNTHDQTSIYTGWI